LLVLFLCAIWSATSALAQTAGAAAAAHSATTAHVEPIDAYIHAVWGTLTRSMSDCASVADPKLKTVPVLYLPRDLTMPADVAAIQKQCHVRVERLPVVITHFDPIKESQIATPGLLYLPHPYVAPARGIVENFFFEIAHYGDVLNGNRTYYLTRSRPPFLSSMIRAVYDAEVAAGHTKEAHAWLAEAYPYAVRDHALWLSPLHRAGGTGLARYCDTRGFGLLLAFLD
jgi:alpha,alpha-trehalase